jgi:hypothetical protein
MGLFGKKKEEKKNFNAPVNQVKNVNEMPELPELPEIPELPSWSNFKDKNLQPAPPLSQQPQSLPSLPNSNIGNKLNQQMIKSVISDYPIPNIPEFPNEYNEESEELSLPEIPREQAHAAGVIKKQYSSELIPPKDNLPKAIEVTDWSKYKGSTALKPSIMQTRTETSMTRKAEPVFVRMDKFEQAVSTIQEIARKISEIENLLNNIKEIKTKENNEIIEWERELELLKTKIDSIDREVFSKVE